MNELFMIEEPNLREAIYMMESAIIDTNRIALALDTQCELAEIYLREAESRYYSESDEFDLERLVYYYEEAEEKTKESKENLFKRLMNGIRNIWDKIVKVVTGKDPKGNDNDEIEVDSALWAVAQKITDIWSEIKQMCLHPIKYWTEGGKLDKLKELLTFTGGAAGAAATIKVTFKTAMQIRQNLKKTTEEVKETGILDTFSTNIQEWLEKHDYGKEPKECTNLLNKFVATIGKCISNITAAMSNVKNAVKGSTTEKDGTNTDNNDDNKNNTEEDTNTDTNKEQKKEGFVKKAGNKVKSIFKKEKDDENNSDSSDNDKQENDSSSKDNTNDESSDNKEDTSQDEKDKKDDKEEKTESGEDFIADAFASFFEEGDDGESYIEEESSFEDEFDKFFMEDASNSMDDVEFETEAKKRSDEYSFHELETILNEIL